MKTHAAVVIVIALFTGCLTESRVCADDKTTDIFDYEGQRAASDAVTKIVFIGDAGTHGPPGNHEFVAGSILIARTLNKVYPNVHAVVRSSKNWPKDLSHADAIIVGLNHGQRAARDPQIFDAVSKGAGFMAIHFGVEVNKGEAGDNYLLWMGGYFETFWSVNPWWTPEFKTFPKHAITRGVKPFSVRDEWYYHMRFVPDLEGVTPILSAVPPVDTIREQPSSRGGNADVFKAVKAGTPQHMAWAHEGENKQRGFGFTGLHRHENLGNDSFRTVLVNGAAWVAGLEIPANGVSSETPDADDLVKLIEEAKAAIAAGK
jgi:hypothetical protein